MRLIQPQVKNARIASGRQSGDDGDGVVFAAKVRGECIAAEATGTPFSRATAIVRLGPIFTAAPPNPA